MRWLGGGSKPNGNDQFTKLLLHFDNNYNDSNYGGGSHTVTAFNSPTFDTPSKFGSNAIRLKAPHVTAPATPERYVQVSDSSDFTLGTNDFTIDFWVNTQTGGAQSPLAEQPFAWRVGMVPASGTPINFLCGSNGSSYSTQVFGPSISWSDNVYRHIAVVRFGNLFTVYVNGVGGTSVTDSLSIADSSNPLKITASGPGGGETILFDEFRVSVGKARWISNFTPPSVPYSRFIGSSF